MENWATAPTRTRVQFVVGAALAVVGVVGCFALAVLDEFTVVVVSSWLMGIWCGLTIGLGFGLMFSMMQGRFPGGPGDPSHRFVDEE